MPAFGSPCARRTRSAGSSRRGSRRGWEPRRSSTWAGRPAAFPSPARRERVPVVLHEQNAVPGLANRSLAHMRLPRAVALSFAEARSRFPGSTTTIVTGNPVRRDIVEAQSRRQALAETARKELDLEEDRRTVVIFGGSQGAIHV